MSLATTRAQDHYIGRDNVVPGVAKAGWTPVKGQLVQRTNNANDEFDLAAAAAPVGIVESTNSGNGTLSIALFRAGDSLILQHDQAGGPALGDKVWPINSTALGTTIPRSVVTTNAGGAGRITALTPRGAGTIEVTF